MNKNFSARCLEEIQEKLSNINTDSLEIIRGDQVSDEKNGIKQTTMTK